MAGGEIKYLDAEAARAAAVKMSKKRKFKGQLPIKENWSQPIFDKIPYLTGFMKSLNDSSGSLSRLLISSESNLTKNLFKGLQIVAVIKASIDLIRIPIMYLVAWWIGVDLPFKLSDGALIIYSAIVFSLTFAALFSPVVVAAFLGLIASSLGLASSVYFFGKHLYGIHTKTNKLKEIERKIKNEEVEFEMLRDEAENLSSASFDDEQISEKVGALTPQYEQKEKKLQKLHDKKAWLQDRLENKFGLRAGLDKSLGIAFATLSFIGTVICFISPVAGLIILCIAALTTAAYLVTSISYSLTSYWLENYYNSHNPLENEPLEFSHNRMPELAASAEKTESYEDSPRHYHLLKKYIEQSQQSNSDDDSLEENETNAGIVKNPTLNLSPFNWPIYSDS